MRVQYTDESLEDLKNIENFLLQKWNEDVFDLFLDKFSKIIELILEDTVIFQKYENTKYRKILITKHNTLIYNIEDDALNIIKILQNFQDPEENLNYFQEED